MALYASDEDEFIFASDAALNHTYRCLECSSPVKVRRGRGRVPHFYHLRKSPSCRLYSKSEDHLIVQLQLQRMISESGSQIERPFLPIHRIADMLWEKEKIAFEIQCSTLDIFEAQKRVIDYKNIGYDVVWLLDDRIFNKRLLRPAEDFLRTQYCYFFSFQRQSSLFYDQMEIILEKKRLKKGFPLKVDLSKPMEKSFFEWPHPLPRLMRTRIQNARRYFQGDLIEKMRPFAAYFEKWRKTEIELVKLHRNPWRIFRFFKKFIVNPYDKLLTWLIERMDRSS